MNVLLLSSRFPWPPFTGDRIRATVWLSALEREASVALVSPDGAVPDSAPRFRFHPARRSLRNGIAGALRVMRGAPVQTLLAAPFDWRGAIERARDEGGEFDAAIVLLSRLDASVRALLPRGLRVLDAIDSLQRSANERAAEGSLPLRWFWREEARRVARAESDAASAYDRVLVVSDDEAHEMRAVAVSNGVDVKPLDADAPRPFDFAFWGRLAYFANADAASWLLQEIWPAIRALQPRATLLIAGADAPPALLAADGRDGVVVRSPVADIAAMARQVRVALFPVRYGTGQSTKVLEAAEAGCAIVATTKAMRGLDPLRKHAFIADDVSELARAASAALSDDVRRRELRRVVETSYARSDVLARLAAIVTRREAAA